LSAPAAKLRRGDRLPEIVTPPPGPRARELCRRLGELEAPGINTLYGDAANILWQEALGANVLDVDGNRYVDLTSGFGVAAVGHRHPRVVAAIRRQSSALIHGLGDAAGHLPRLELAERLQRLAPVDEAQVYYAVTGAEAVEIAVKTALLATGRRRLLAFEPAYHGLTLGALAATSRPEFRQPFAAHLHPHLERLPYACDPGRIAAELGRGEPFAAVLVEPIVGREGVLVPPAGWLRSLADLCRERGTLLIADEIFTGGGRTGRWFAVAAEDVRPDLLCCGKGLTGGLPLAAVVGRAPLLAAWRTPGEALHTATFVANPLACAAAAAAVDVLEEDALPERARRLGEDVAARLEGWTRFAAVAAVRGRGLLWGVELASRNLAGELVDRARRRGYLCLAGGPEGKVLQIVPPLTVRRRQLEAALDALEDLLDGDTNAW
jgi:4-aminobutyrate aminotransferase / (S)-3-amino-2-methylpropionate transaminase / 5-aminovalerate transaminase